MPNHDAGAPGGAECRLRVVSEAEGQAPGVAGLEMKRAHESFVRSSLERQPDAIADFQAPLIEEVGEPSQHRVAVLLADPLVVEDPENGVRLSDRDVDGSQLGAF